MGNYSWGEYKANAEVERLTQLVKDERQRHQQECWDLRNRERRTEAEAERLREALRVLRDAAWHVPVALDRTPDQQARVQAFSEAVVAVGERFGLPDEKVLLSEAEVAAALEADR